GGMVPPLGNYAAHPISPAAGDVPLPMRPIPACFVADVMLYAGAWYLLLRGIPALRRWRRRRRGRCEACGYDLAGVPGGVCPECGGARSASALHDRRDGRDEDEDQRVVQAVGGH